METVTDFIFLGSKITVDCDCSHVIKRHLLLGRKAMTNPDSLLKRRDSTLLTKVHLVKAMVFPVTHKGSWALKNWCFWTVVLEMTLESPLDRKETQPVNPKGNQSWVFIGKTDTEAPIFWPPNVRNWIIGKDPDAGKDWRQEEKGMTEDEMVGWHHRLMDMSLNKFRKLMMDREAWRAAVFGLQRVFGSQRVRHDWAIEMNWTELKLL